MTLNIEEYKVKRKKIIDRVSSLMIKYPDKIKPVQSLLEQFPHTSMLLIIKVEEIKYELEEMEHAIDQLMRNLYNDFLYRLDDIENEGLK